jgi:hypothetical protein
MGNGKDVTLGPWQRTLSVLWALFDLNPLALGEDPMLDEHVSPEGDGIISENFTE